MNHLPQTTVTVRRDHRTRRPTHSRYRLRWITTELSLPLTVTYRSILAWAQGLGRRRIGLRVRERIRDFVLLDQHGDAHRMHYNRDAPAIVLIAQGNGRQIVQSFLNDYRALRDD